MGVQQLGTRVQQEQQPVYQCVYAVVAEDNKFEIVHCCSMSPRLSLLRLLKL